MAKHMSSNEYGIPIFRNPGQYLKAKLAILERDFCIHPTDEELAHLKTLETQWDIDRGIRTLISTRW